MRRCPPSRTFGPFTELAEALVKRCKRGFGISKWNKPRFYWLRNRAPTALEYRYLD